MYSKLPNLVLGFHGCNKSTFENVIEKNQHLKKSLNAYDWLGNGIYFWEQNYQRALEWAENRYGKDDAAVIGAVIDLGYCLNLTDSASADLLREGYESLVINCKGMGKCVPNNRKINIYNDILLRDLDCAVIQQIHNNNALMGGKAFDSVRGVFVEGKETFPGSAMREKTHIQLCICNLNCIKGYFTPLAQNSDYSMP